MGSGSSATTGTRSRRTDWLRRTISSAPCSGKSTSPKTSGGKRFVKPYRLSEQQRCAILAPLEQRGIGDAECRNLFAAALEYDLAICHQLVALADPFPLPAQERRPSRDDAAIAALTQAADSLAQRLQDLDAATSHLLQQGLEDRDRFQRCYGEEYLKSLGCELRRFADIGELLKQDAPSRSSEPALAESTRRFLLRAANAYEDCFELAPDAKPDSPFVTTLEAIDVATEIGVPTDRATLTLVLGQD